MWEKNLKEKGYVYMYNWTTLLHSWNYHNLVNQIYVNKTLKKFKKRNPGKIFTFMKKRWNVKIVFSICFAASHYKGMPNTLQQMWHHHSPSRGTALSISASSHHSSKLCPWALCFILIYFLHLLAGCDKDNCFFALCHFRVGEGRTYIIVINVISKLQILL